MRMTGWKTWASGFAGIFSGLGIILTAVSTGNFDMDVFQGGMVLIINGGAVIGIGHKIEKT